MARLYVNRRSELSALKEAFEAAGATCYRVRIDCGCHTSQNDRRNGLIVLSGGQLILEVVRCRGCANTPRLPKGE